jgi:hypothetical protein
MKKLFLFFYIIPFISFGQTITTEMFVEPIYTGVNMSIAFDGVSELDQFDGGIIGAFYDLDNDGILECVGLDYVHDEFFIFTVWGNDELTPFKEGLDEGDFPIFSILSTDGQTIMLSDLSSFSGFQINALNINYSQVSTSASICQDSSACNFIDFNYQIDSIESNCTGLIGCMDSDYLEFNSQATCNNLGCLTEIILGCLNNEAINYNSYANTSGDTCIFLDEIYNSAFEAGASSVTILEGISQSDLDSAFVAGVSSVIPEDGVSQADLDAAVAAIIPEDGISQLDVDLAYDSGVSSVIPEDGVSQADLDAAVAAIIPDDGISQSDVDFAFNFGISTVIPEDGVSQADLDAAVAAIIPEDGISQLDVDIAYIDGYDAGMISSENQQTIIEVDAFLLMPEGWSFFGFTCIDPLNLIEAFAPVVNQVLIVKNNDGAVYLPEYGFNGIGDLTYGLGYQIKLTDAIENFQFCPQILPSVD